MRARKRFKPGRRNYAHTKQSLKMNLLLLFLSLLFLAGTSRLFYMVTSHRLYQPIEWRINRIAQKAPEPAAQTKQAHESSKTASAGKAIASEKVTASGMDYLFWKILREEEPEKRH